MAVGAEEIWERYELAAQGLPTSDTGFEWMLEDPDEFEFRMLLRRFAQRDALFDRLSKYELEPIPIFDPAAVEELAASLAAAYKRAAQPFADTHYLWAGSEQPMEIEYLAADACSAGSKDASGVWQIVSDAASSDLSTVTGGQALRSVLEGRVRSIGLFYLLGPLISCESDFGADLALRKSGRGIWIDDGRLCIREPRFEPHWTELDNWAPELDWPTKKGSG